MASAALLAMTSAALLLSNVGKTRFFGDESGWISYSYQTTDLFLNGEFGPRQLSSLWDNYGNLNPQLGKLLLGIPLVACSDLLLDGARYTAVFPWNRPGSYQERLARAEVPPREILLLARSITALYGVLCVLTVFACTAMLFGVWAGLLAGALVLGSPLFVESVTRSMTDAQFNWLLVLALLVEAPALRAHPRRRDLILAALCGLVAGLASSVKLTGFLTIGVTHLSLLGLRVLREKLSLRRAGENAALFAFVTLTSIYTLNPFYWPEVSEIRPAELMREVRGFAFDGKRVELPLPFLDYMGAVYYNRKEIVDEFPQLYNLLRPFELPAHFLRWRTLTVAQAKMFSWPGPRLEVIGRRLAIDFTNFRFEWIFLIWGTAAHLRRAISEWRAGRVSAYLVPPLWFAANLVLLLSLVRFYGDRYFLPTVVAERILIAVGLFSAADLLLRRVRARFPASSVARS